MEKIREQDIGELVREKDRQCRREHREFWAVVQYHGNASAFNGYHWQHSDYSGITCNSCGRYWRTKAGYVEDLPSQEQYERTRGEADGSSRGPVQGHDHG
jgi:hypothetical protein